MKLIDLHFNKKGKVSDKWESYFPVYENLFQEFKDKEIKLLEIGLQNGGSLETWAQYFTNAKKILGIDVDVKCGELVFDDPRISVIVGDGRIVHDNDMFDIIIDDGSHLSDDMVVQFESWFKQLKDGGLYIVEDIHTLWMFKHSGRSAIDFFSKMINDVNREFWKDPNSHHIESIEFRNSLIIIRKGDSKLGKRYVCGDIASVNPVVLSLKEQDI